MTNFNERTNTLLYKNIISHTLFSRGWCFLCVRMDCYFDPSSSGHSSTSSPSWLGLLNRGSLRAASPQSASWFSRWHLVPNWLQLTTATKSSRLCPGYIFVWHLPASAVLPLIYTGASLDWRSICYKWRGTQHSSKPQHYWNLTIRQFNVKCRTLVGVVSSICAKILKL